MNPFDFLNSINMTKKNLIVDDISEKSYNPFIVNRGLSYFQDTIHYAQEMNRAHFLPKKLQYDFLINIVRKRKRFSKWFKKEKNDRIELIMEYYKYNERRAYEVDKLLSESEIEQIRKEMELGGIKKGK